MLNVFQVFSLGVEMGSLSTYRFLVLRLINVLLEFCKNEDELVETSSYKSIFENWSQYKVFCVKIFSKEIILFLYIGILL